MQIEHFELNWRTFFFDFRAKSRVIRTTLPQVYFRQIAASLDEFIDHLFFRLRQETRINIHRHFGKFGVLAIYIIA